MRMRSRIAVCCAKWVYRMIHLFHLGDGAALPGAVAKRIDPGILRMLAGMVTEGVLVVLGTNGKTTVNSILYQVLKEQGKTVLANRTGANMENGITTAFVLAADAREGIQADYACIEVDENAAFTVLPQLMPAGILLTNLFRDQLDRYGEVDAVYERIRRAIFQTPDAVLILNGDDALLSDLLSECPNRAVSYGIEEAVFDEAAKPRVREGVFCRFCGRRLVYTLVHYGQLGHYYCPGCGRKRPRPDDWADRVHIEGEACCFRLDGRLLRPRMTARYQIYNILAAYAALKAVEGPVDRFGSAIEKFDFDNHRESRFYIDGASIQLYLAKNPVGFQQKLSLLCQDPGRKDVLILVNDTAQDGRDVSWLWDVDFEYLKEARPAAIVVGGKRRYDMGLRLKYEEIPCRVTEHIPKAIRKLAASGTKNLYILVNYSSLYPIHRMLCRWEEKENIYSWKEEEK